MNDFKSKLKAAQDKLTELQSADMRCIMVDRGYGHVSSFTYDRNKIRKARDDAKRLFGFVPENLR